MNSVGLTPAMPKEIDSKGTWAQIAKKVSPLEEEDTPICVCG